MADAFWYDGGDGFPLVDPATSRASLVAAVLGAGEPFQGTRHLAGILTTRRRVLDPSTGRRVTRDWRTAVAVMWDNGMAPDLNVRTFRELMAEVGQHGGADEVLVYGRIATFGGRAVQFRQFGVRARSN